MLLLKLLSKHVPAMLLSLEELIQKFRLYNQMLSICAGEGRIRAHNLLEQDFSDQSTAIGIASLKAASESELALQLES